MQNNWYIFYLSFAVLQECVSQDAWKAQPWVFWLQGSHPTLTPTWGQCIAHSLNLGLTTWFTLDNGVWVKLCQFWPLALEVLCVFRLPFWPPPWKEHVPAYLLFQGWWETQRAELPRLRMRSGATSDLQPWNRTAQKSPRSAELQSMHNV